MQEEIQIVDVHAELARLGSEGKKKGQVKGCLFNLIIYSQNPERSLFFKGMIETITETFPCRIIFIECDSQASKNWLKVDVKEEIVKKNGSTISCDRIDITCTTSFLNRVPYIVLPHFVPDLPIFLLWGQDPTQENEILPYLQQFATRLIFDSDSSSDIRAFCRKMLSDQPLRKISVTDMNWASLTSWREILFQIFDIEKKIEQLCNCRKLTIRYNGKPSEMNQHTERRAVYLQGWLSAQLQWQYLHGDLKDQNLKIVYKNRKGETEVNLVAENYPNLPSGAISAVEIETENEMVYNLARISAQPFIKTHISTKDFCEMPTTLPLRHSKKGLIFMNEIFFLPCSQHYWNMLKAIEPLQVPC